MRYTARTYKEIKADETIKKNKPVNLNNFVFGMFFNSRNCACRTGFHTDVFMGRIVLKYDARSNG